MFIGGGHVNTEILHGLVTASPKSQREIASDLGMSQQRFNNYVNGQREPDFETASRIAAYFNVSLTYLLGEKQEEPLFSADEMSLLADYRQFNGEGKARLREFTRAMRRSRLYEVGTDYFAQ